MLPFAIFFVILEKFENYVMNIMISFMSRNYAYQFIMQISY